MPEPSLGVAREPIGTPHPTSRPLLYFRRAISAIARRQNGSQSMGTRILGRVREGTLLNAPNLGTWLRGATLYTIAQVRCPSSECAVINDDMVIPSYYSQVTDLTCDSTGRAR